VIVGVVRDGKVASAHEYFDSVAAARLFAHLAG
jgi:ketosteroid isomerase-like protein